MTKSKIAIVIAPSVSAEINQAFCKVGSSPSMEMLRKIIVSVSQAGSIALLLPVDDVDQAIEPLLEVAEGFIFICPPQLESDVTVDASNGGDAFVRKLGRAVITDARNSSMIIGAGEFFAAEKEWQDWAYFYRAGANHLAFEESVEFWNGLKEFVQSASVISRFAHLARGNREGVRMALEIKSPVTNG